MDSLHQPPSSRASAGAVPTASSSGGPASSFQVGYFSHPRLQLKGRFLSASLGDPTKPSHTCSLSKIPDLLSLRL